MKPTGSEGEEDRASQCKGIKRDGTACRNPPAEGEEYCKFHIGQKDQATLTKHSDLEQPSQWEYLGVDQAAIGTPSESTSTPATEAEQSWVGYGVALLLVIEILLAFWLFVTNNTSKLGMAILLVLITMPVVFWSKTQDWVSGIFKKTWSAICASFLVLTTLLYFTGLFVAVVKLMFWLNLAINLLLLLWSLGKDFKEMGEKRAWVVGSMIVIFLSYAGVQSLDQTETREAASQSSTEDSCGSSECPVGTTYEVVEVDDQSHKALDRPLSSYSIEELSELPIDKKIIYSIVVPPSIKQAEVRPTVEKIIFDFTRKDPEIDEIELQIYSDREIVGQGWDVALAIWGPNGDLGNVMPRIAETNDRSSYKISIQIKENLEDYLKERAESETKFGLNEEQRRAVFWETVRAEDRASVDAERLYPYNFIVCKGITKKEAEENFQKSIELYDELRTEYKRQVAKKHGISDGELLLVEGEGNRKLWPMPPPPDPKDFCP